jgi:carbon starvation protein
MHLRDPHRQSGTRARGGPALALITLAPLLWLTAVTGTASMQKIFDGDPKIGFLAAATDLQSKLPVLQSALVDAEKSQSPDAIAAAKKALHANRALHLNALLDAAVTGAFFVMVATILLLSAREWILLLARKKLAQLRETPPVWLPAYALAAETRSFNIFGALGLALLMIKELSGEAAIARERQIAPCEVCAAEKHGVERERQLYLNQTVKRFNGINRCC